VAKVASGTVCDLDCAALDLFVGMP
jgi:hypothetical protein